MDSNWGFQEKWPNRMNKFWREGGFRGGGRLDSLFINIQISFGLREVQIQFRLNLKIPSQSPCLVDNVEIRE